MKKSINTSLSIAASALVLVSSSDSSRSLAASSVECDGRSLITELSVTSPAKLESVMAKATHEENNEAVFWRIENEAQPPSFILGTLHIAHESLQALSPAVGHAIATARVVALEQEQLSRGAYGQVMAQAGKLMSARDKPLQRLLDDSDARMGDIRKGLITDRNRRMAERAMPLFESGGAFVAIGAAHLPGSDGVISILKRSGFTVTPVE